MVRLYFVVIRVVEGRACRRRVDWWSHSWEVLRYGIVTDDTWKLKVLDSVVKKDRILVEEGFKDVCT